MPTFPARIPLPTTAPVPLVRPASAPPAATPAPALQSTGEALTLDALMARQKMAAGRQQGNMEQPVTNIPQGLGQLGWTLVNALQERRAEKDIAAGQADVAKAFGQVDWNTGQMPPEAMQLLMSRDPATGMEMYKTAMALRAAQGKTEQWTPIDTPEGENGQWYQNQNGDTKKVGGGADTSAWKPTDIAARADDYTKAAAVYETAAPAWASMQESWNRVKDLKSGDTSPGAGVADYSLVISLAKLMDPNSVVREGEVETVRKTGGATDSLIGILNQLTGGGSLSPEVRRGLMTEANGRMKAYYNQAAGKHKWISEVASRHGVNPNDVVPPLAEFVPWSEEQQDPNKPDPNKPDPNAVPGTSPYPGPQPDNWPADTGYPDAAQWAKMTEEDRQAFIDQIKQLNVRTVP